MSAARLDRLALLGSVAALAALQLWLRPLLPVDETRYLAVAWEMWWRGDFLLPWLNGEPYSHKPPLLFWLIHALWAVFGVSELAARLLPVFISLVALWGSTRLAERLWPEQAAAIGALVPWLLLGGVFWNNFFSLLQFDLLLLLAALLAWHGLLTALHSPLGGWSLVALGIGLGVLAKGPVILVPVLPAVLLAPWWAGQSPRPGWPRWYLLGLLAVAAGAALALAWAVPAGLAGGDAYRQAIFWGQSAGRVLDSFAHRSPWWSYLLWLPLMWLPWLLWPQLWTAARRAPPSDLGTRFCAAVLVPALLVFTLISGKQGKYLVPLLPLIAALFAHWLVMAEQDGQRYRAAFVAAFLVPSGGLLALLPWLPTGPEWLARVQPLWGGALLVWGGLFLFLRLPLAALVRAAALGALLWSAVVTLALVEPARPAYDLAAISQTLSALQAEGRAIAWLGKYHGQFHFLGRLQQRIEPLQARARLQAWLDANPDGYLLVNYKTPQPQVPAALQVQPYRGGSLVLWPVARLRAQPHWVDALPGNA
ncbi:MAG: glycosyltransferase family 39 protein [Gammaproteobacteria bacterium]|nr:MAG: glycosyltransferase family 39 protein [Gammaproteobacteria bacterium]